jgi:hypothetical protein
MDGSGNAIVVTSVYTSKLPAGGSTWSTPALLAAGSSPVAAGDAAGTFVVALQAAAGPIAYTSPPGGGFGAATAFPATDTISGLTMVSGRAILILSPGGVSAETVS